MMSTYPQLEPVYPVGNCGVMAITEKHGNEHGAALTYAQFGLLAIAQDDRIGAADWLKLWVCGHQG